MSSREEQKEWFRTTRWTVVLQAAESSHPEFGVALSKLCEDYWAPLFNFLRARGYSPHDAEDLVQEFFSRLLAKKYLKDVDRSKGRFRSFLLASVKHFLADAFDRERAQKRGGGRAKVSLDVAGADALLSESLQKHEAPERSFDRCWAAVVVDRANRRLEAAYEKKGKIERYRALRPRLSGRAEGESIADTARELGLTEVACKGELHRLRLLFRDYLRQEVAHTVTAHEEVDDELRYLISIL